MSYLSDIKSTLSSTWLRDKLPIQERALLLSEISESIDSEEYDKIDENGNYAGYDIDKAISDLSKYDKESIKYENQRNQKYITCILDSVIGDGLTKNKKYPVLKEDNGLYTIVDDNNNIEVYSEFFFE